MGQINPQNSDFAYFGEFYPVTLTFVKLKHLFCYCMSDHPLGKNKLNILRNEQYPSNKNSKLVLTNDIMLNYYQYSNRIMFNISLS